MSFLDLFRRQGSAPVARERLPPPCTLQTAGHCLNTPLRTGGPGMIRQV